MTTSSSQLCEGCVVIGSLFNEPMRVETELLQRTDEEIGKASIEKEKGVPGADGRLAQAENRHAELLARRERRRQELERQRSLSLQAVERIASVLILPHPEREAPDVRHMYYLSVNAMTRPM